MDFELETQRETKEIKKSKCCYHVKYNMILLQ